MGLSRQLQDVMDAIRQRGEWRTPWLTEAELLDYVNDSISALRDFIAVVDPFCSKLMRRADITIVSGQARYNLPEYQYLLYGVSIYDGSTADGYYVLEQYRWDERYADGYENQNKKNTRWLQIGDQIALTPTPNFNGKLIIDYAEAFYPVRTTDSIDFDNSWNEWVVLDVCIKCCAKEESDPSVYMAQQKAVQDRIQSTIKIQNDIQDIAKSDALSNTLASMRRAIRGRGAWTRQDVSDNQLTEWINSGIRALVDIEILQNPLMFNTLKDISVVSGTDKYALPDDLYRLTGVAVDSTDGYLLLERYNFSERYDYNVNTSDKEYARYIVLGDYIEFMPSPTWTANVRLSYVSLPTALSNPTDTFDFQNGWQEWVILDACEKMAISKAQNPQAYAVQKAEVIDRIKKSMIKDISKPITVTDVSRRWSYVSPVRRW